MTAVAETPNGERKPNTHYKSLKKPQRPDFTARDEILGKLQAKVQEFNAKAKEKASELDALQNETRSNNKLESARRSLANTLHSKTQAKKLLELANKRLQELKASTKLPKATRASNLTPNDILEAMEQLKERHDAEGDSEERARIVARMQNLHTSYNQLVNERTVVAQGTAESLSVTLQAEIDGYRKQLDDLSKTEASQRAELESWNSRLNASKPQIEALRQERQQCLDVVRSLREKMTDINEQYQAKFDDFKAALKEWNAEMDVVMKARREERTEELRHREEARAAREREARGPPFALEIMRCDQLLDWCKQYRCSESGQADGKPDASSNGNAESAGINEHAGDNGHGQELSGMVAISKKNIEDEDDVFATPGRTKGKRKSARRAARGTPEGKRDGHGSGKVLLDMETLALISTMRLRVPSTVGDVAELAAAARTKKTEYEDKQRRALAGEAVEGEDGVPSGGEGAGTVPEDEAGAVERGRPRVTLRADEVFGSVLVEITA